MLDISSLNLGFGDAENYRRRENKDLFNKIFVKNKFLEQLLSPNVFFLIGEKGTGKTAYSVYLSNNNYKNSSSFLKYIRDTDYEKFIELKRNKSLGLSAYADIWKVILLLLLSKSIEPRELDEHPFSKSAKIKALRKTIDGYRSDAFSPEISNALQIVSENEYFINLFTEIFGVDFSGGEKTTVNKTGFQASLSRIEYSFKDALSMLKLRKNHLLLIDGIDVRPYNIEYNDYLHCIKGLANAAWNLNNDFFPSIKDSSGRCRIVLLLRPDIFNSLGLQNMNNKVRDNAVFLDWRTTYPAYKTSPIFELSDKMLSAQQPVSYPLGEAWNSYFPWSLSSTNKSRERDDSFIGMLRLSLVVLETY